MANKRMEIYMFCMSFSTKCASLLRNLQVLVPQIPTGDTLSVSSLHSKVHSLASILT